MDSSFFIYMFTLGLGTSLHCVSMCGPLVLTYAVKGSEGGPWYRRLTPNVAYQGAKLVSYMLVGLLLGSVGAFFNIDSIRPYVMLLAGAFMIVLGLGMTGKVRWATRLTPRPPKWLMSAIIRLRKKSTADAKSGDDTLATPILFGLMTGLLPCGPLMAAQVSAAASGSALTGALGMALFAAGTAPLMLVFGTAGSMVPARWKSRMMTALAVGVMIFGLVFINRGLMLTGAPVTFNTVKAAVLGGQVAQKADAEYATAADGVVEVPIVIENTQFEPQNVQIPADKRVRLVVDRREDVSCSNQIAIPQAGVLADLAPNAVTKVDVPPMKAGSYTLTCGMGMMSGELTVGGSASPGAAPALWLGLAIASGVGALFYVRRRGAPTEAAGHKAAASGKKMNPRQTILIGAAVAFAIFLGLAMGGLLG